METMQLHLIQHVRCRKEEKYGYGSKERKMNLASVNDRGREVLNEVHVYPSSANF